VIFCSRRRVIINLSALVLVGGSTAFAAEAPVVTFEALFPTPLFDTDALATPAGASLRLGLKITNLSRQTLWLSTYGTVSPQVLDATGHLVPFAGGTNQARAMHASDIVQVRPGRSLVITMTTTLRTRSDELQWRDSNGLTGTWLLHRAGVPYRLRLRYLSGAAASIGPLALPAKLWSGEGETQTTVLPI
jgi:hypothetical protein